MNKYLLLIILSFLFKISNGQSLRDKLWDFVSECHESILDGYELSYDSIPENLSQYCQTCIDDANNGYLFIEGGWPACGCSCHINVGAYRTSKGNYALIKYEIWPCSNSFGIYSNQDLQEIMPEGFNLTNFNPNAKIDSISYFHLEMEIPRIGTDTKVRVKLFPIGQIGKESNGISFNTDNSDIIFNPYALTDIVDELSDESQIQLILDGKIESLPMNIKKEVDRHIGESKAYKSLKNLQHQLLYVKNIYEQYVSFQNTEIVLSWNREDGRFQVKSKSGKPKKLTFFQFLKSANYFTYVC